MRNAIFAILAIIIGVAAGISAADAGALAKKTYLHEPYQGNDGGAN